MHVRNPAGVAFADVIALCCFSSVCKRILKRMHVAGLCVQAQRAALEKLDEEDDGPKQDPSDNAGKTSG